MTADRVTEFTPTLPEMIQDVAALESSSELLRELNSRETNLVMIDVEGNIYLIDQMRRAYLAKKPVPADDLDEL